MLTAKQHELIRFIQRKLEETGISPSFEEMKEALELKSKSGVHRLISALEERGFIRRLPNRARALEVLKGPEDAVATLRAARPANDAATTGRAMPRFAPQAANDVIELPLHGRIAPAGARTAAELGLPGRPATAKRDVLGSTFGADRNPRGRVRRTARGGPRSAPAPL